MRLHSRSIRLAPPLVCALALALAAAGAASAQQAPPEQSGMQPVIPGRPFPLGSFANLNAEAGGAEIIDMSQYLGKRPVLLHYWIPGNTWSEDVLVELQSLVKEIGEERIALFGVAVPRPGRDESAIRARIQEKGIAVPVLSDKDFRIGKQLRIAMVPNISIIDRTGSLRLTNGASLSQVLGYKLDLAGVIRRTAEKGDLMTYGYLDPYYPVRELEGEQAPDFKAPLLSTKVEQRWHSMIDATKVNVLIFWSVDCPHCRTSLPEINTWLKSNPDGVNVVSCATARDESIRTRTAEFCRINDFKFPTLIDEASSIGDLYRVTSTPTIVIVRPDGVVDSAIVSGHQDFGKTIEKKKKELLGAPSS
jgi:peroxiredoxin